MSAAISHIPKVSVLMLTYNQQTYLPEAIHSVVAQQTDFPYEVVIGNDASTDRTRLVCEEWQQRAASKQGNCIIRLINHEHNKGLAYNFIDTYAQCKGDYIAICEGDDFWTSRHKLQRQADFLDRHPDFAISFHRVINYYEEQGEKSLSNGLQQRVTDISDLARKNYITNVSAMFRRLPEPLPDWMKGVGTYDYAMHMLGAQYGKIHFMQCPMAVYRQHGGALWSKEDATRKWEIAIDIRERLMNYFRDKRQDVYVLLRQAFIDNCVALARYHQGNSSGSTMADTMYRRILVYLPDMDRTTFDALVTCPPKSRGRFAQALSAVRKKLSRLVPLPSIND